MPNKFNLSKPAILFCGSLLGLSIPSLANAIPKVNPCPGIYYEEPHDTTRIVPLGCPPNTATRIKQGEQLSIPTIPLTVRPSSESEQKVIARVIPYLGKINMRLKNNMQTTLSYQMIGDIKPQSLDGGEEIMLQNVSVPLTFTMLRSDGGLLRMLPVTNAQDNILDISFTEASGLGDSQLTLRIQDQGQVYAY